MSRECQVNVRFYPPPAALRACFTTFYLIEFAVPDGGVVEDFLHPEWANLRFLQGSVPVAEGKGGRLLSGTQFCATGPSSHAVRFTIGPRARMWGIGLLPLGWAQFVGCDAGACADALLDGNREAPFDRFRPLGDVLFGARPDPEVEYARIAEFFGGIAGDPPADAARIHAIHAALIDPEVDSVSQFVAQSGLAQRTLERLSHRYFGFSPKLLLRRQRFLRSLAHYVLDPSLKWIGALDGSYHDQAQFVRDFKQFMGMSPRRYAALDKPILGAVMQARAAFAGRPVQGLDGPDGGGVSS